MADYVELDRRFRNAVDESDGETTARLNYPASWNQVEAGLSWAEVLSHRLVVVLGEPGSGKTAEFKAQARLRDPSATPRFFVRLDDLIQGSLNGALGPEHAKRFQAVQAFAQNHEIAPRSAHDLFRIACGRLWDLKKEVEGVENSLRNAVRPSDDESVMQQWLQRQLVERAKGRYTIPKEAEDDAGNRPDLRFDHPGIMSVMAEMKLADMPHWTVEKLIDGLEKQLVGKYLLAHNAGYGIYIIGNSGRRADGWKDPVTGSLLSFGEVAATLRQRAREIMESCDALLGLEVIAIDFSSPRKS